MPPSHPKHFLTVIGQTPEPKEKNEASVRPVEVQGPVIREDEIMYHFYKNGRVGSDYRKASTTFMVRLFNDLLRGMTPPRPIMKSGGADDVTTTKKKKTVVSFFVPFLPPNERLRLAEVRFLRHPSARKRKKRYKLRIDVVRSGRRVERVMLRERADIQRDYDVFDVSRLLQPWINTHHGNVSLQIRLPRKLEKNILLKDSTMKSTSLIALYLEDSEFLKNMYESYTTDDVHANSSDPTGGSNEASRRRTRSKREAKKRRHKSGRKGKRWYRAGKHEKCQMYDFKVDFDFIGWGQWIIHPKSFNSRFCYGECPSPVDTKYKPTNHAMLQTLMRQKKPRLAPPTCCVPIKLKPLSMLYFEYDEIVVRHHENMIADESRNYDHIMLTRTVGLQEDRVSCKELMGERAVPEATELPESFGELESLEFVHFGSMLDEIERSNWVNGNWLQQLPASFPQLRMLTTLRLDENQIQFLPDDFGQLCNLESFNIEVKVQWQCQE
nr:hypothetical protein BaRGS_000201 [Batillaria attramentaria]